MLQLKQKKPLSNAQIKTKAAQAFRGNLFGLMGASFCIILVVFAALSLLTKFTDGQIANSMLQTGINALVVIAVFPLQLGLVRYCSIVYQRGGGASWRELLHYYRRYFANTVFMALAVVFIGVAIQQLALLIVNLTADMLDRNTALTFSVAFQLGMIFYLMLRLCPSPWLFIEDPMRSTIRILEHSFNLTKGKNGKTLRFFWWAPAALVFVLALVGLFSSGQNMMAANGIIIVGTVYFIPRLLVEMSGYVINILTVDKLSRSKEG
ncbi:MAG: hypothetical protein LBH21_02280 [Gracilibacteraceae bacterium]|jgi:hypothetical protein|nr:hypothetical protein [Gracilibacteraceae bacterium]